MDFIYYSIIFIYLFLLQTLYFQLADKFNIIDKPNERSSHTKITLRGGGIIFYLGVLIYFIVSGFEYFWFFSGLTLISFISFADDIKPQKRTVRLLFHFSAMLLMFYQWQLFSFPWYFTIIALILCTGILNAYNFMDGINGITGAYSTIIFISFWYINNYVYRFIDNTLIYTVLLSLLVFNIFNFRKKAKCFAGDVGAISIAFIIVFLLGKLFIETDKIGYIALLSVYGVDSVLTIIHRLLLKENIFEPHRKHVFQIMANELHMPHLLVSSIYAGLQLLITAGLILFYKNDIVYLIIVIFVLSLIYILFKKKYFHLHISGK